MTQIAWVAPIEHAWNNVVIPLTSTCILGVIYLIRMNNIIIKYSTHKTDC